MSNRDSYSDYPQKSQQTAVSGGTVLAERIAQNGQKYTGWPEN
jgi:hypothetical protein